VALMVTQVEWDRRRALLLSCAADDMLVQDYAALTGLTPKQVARVLRDNPDIPRNRKRRAMSKLVLAERLRLVSERASASMPRRKLASLCGLTEKQVVDVLAAHPEIPRPAPGAQPGSHNHQFAAGRRIHPNGYALVTAPDHPHGRVHAGRSTRAAIVAEHRLVMEQTLGRYLSPEEVVDHVDGLTLHNAPENLRLFPSNADHLRHTLAGKVPKWSEAGLANMQVGRRGLSGRQPVCSYSQRRARGDVRLLQILRLAYALGTDSPYLSGTRHHLERAGLYPLSDTSTIQALRELDRVWLEAHPR